MLWYIVKLVLLLPLIGALIYGSLKLTQRMQARLGANPAAPRAVRVVETLMLSPTLKAGGDRVPRAGDSGLGVAQRTVALAEAPAREPRDV